MTHLLHLLQCFALNELERSNKFMVKARESSKMTRDNRPTWYIHNYLTNVAKLVLDDMFVFCAIEGASRSYFTLDGCLFARVDGHRGYVEGDVSQINEKEND